MTGEAAAGRLNLTYESFKLRKAKAVRSKAKFRQV
jgi:hypothetical protein